MSKQLRTDPVASEPVRAMPPGSDNAMTLAEYYPYRSAEARDNCLCYLDRAAAALWPAVSEERMIPTTFGETFVRIGGPAGAPTLILLHGGGGTSLMWAPNIKALSSEYRTVAVDQLGEFGKSGCARPPESLEDLTSWLHEVVVALEPQQRVSLCGMSYGGALAAQYALRFSERLDNLVLLAPGSTVLRPPTAFWFRLLVLAIRRQSGLPGFFRWVFADMARKDPEWVRSTIEQLSLNMRSIQRHRLPIPPVLTDTEWRSLRVRMLFLVGENEVIYSSAEKAVQRVMRLAPQVTAAVIRGAGHDLTFAQAEIVNNRILQFLTEGRAQSNTIGCGG